VTARHPDKDNVVFISPPNHSHLHTLDFFLRIGSTAQVELYGLHAQAWIASDDVIW
jgi:hypothetical protein